MQGDRACGEQGVRAGLQKPAVSRVLEPTYGGVRITSPY